MIAVKNQYNVEIRDNVYKENFDNTFEGVTRRNYTSELQENNNAVGTYIEVMKDEYLSVNDTIATVGILHVA